ncbi:hypothetical protein B0H14DRAFT_3439168 [Mycena olivaceomarginata]|nr:hypothetical protein B0H14DRAFT_3439168 [Mycena olivaceomarginata]
MQPEDYEEYQTPTASEESDTAEFDSSVTTDGTLADTFTEILAVIVTNVKVARRARRPLIRVLLVLIVTVVHTHFSPCRTRISDKLDKPVPLVLKPQAKRRPLHGRPHRCPQSSPVGTPLEKLQDAPHLRFCVPHCFGAGFFPFDPEGLESMPRPVLTNPHAV